MNIKKLAIILLLLLACAAGLSIGSARQRWEYPLPKPPRFRLIPTTDPNNNWDDANDVYTINGRLDVIDVNMSGGMIINRTSVTSSPYTVLASDNHISVTTSTTAITLNLLAIVNGRVHHIKDQDGNAAGKNITVTPNGAETVEQAASLTINTNFASVTIVGNSTTSNWEIQ